MSDVKSGNVKWFNATKGYGFIEYEGGEDIFVHYSSIVSDGFRSLNDGDQVSFELEESDKGLQAKNVNVTTAAAPKSRKYRKEEAQARAN